MNPKSVVIRGIRNGYVINLVSTTRGGNQIREEWFETTFDNVLAELQQRFSKIKEKEDGKKK